MSDHRPDVGVGVGVLVTKGDELLLVQRRHHGAGSWATPGGYLDIGESPESCAAREVAEETGIEVTDVAFWAVTNDIHPDGKHNVTLWLTARHAAGDPHLASDESEAVAWFPLTALPNPLYLSTDNVLSGNTYPRGRAWPGEQ